MLTTNPSDVVVQLKLFSCKFRSTVQIHQTVRGLVTASSNLCREMLGKPHINAQAELREWP